MTEEHGGGFVTDDDKRWLRLYEEAAQIYTPDELREWLRMVGQGTWDERSMRAIEARRILRERRQPIEDSWQRWTVKI